MSTIREVLETKGHDVYTIPIDASIDDAVVEMCRVKAGALLIVDESFNPTGIVTERDLLVRVLLAHRDPNTTSVGEVMTRQLICLDEDDTVSSAMALMTRARCRHLPVVRAGVVGMVSIGDLVRAVSGQHEYEARVLHDYVEGRYPG
jgi:CBS domain-containing protein